MKPTKARLTSWGRVKRGAGHVALPRFRDELSEVLRDTRPHLAIGARRSYGDTGMLDDGVLIDMTALDRFESFDPQTGLLSAEAGVQLAQVMAVLVPQGWFPPVTPGTRFVTLGGALANDVHGKNHHRAGAFGRHVAEFTLRRSDEQATLVCRPQDPLFAATVGGLGLTGVIESVQLRLQPIASAWLDLETVPMKGLDDFFAISAESESFEHTVAWIDCTATGRSLGKGVFTRANWRRDGRLDPHRAGGSRVPFEAPGFLLNPLSLKAFNALYHLASISKLRQVRAHYSSVFHPLDAVTDWNLLYGPAGFYQYQCLIPSAAGPDPVRRLLQVIGEHRQGSTLAVLKTFGALPSAGLLSFPAPGCTLALDFPNRGLRTLDLMARLDEIVLDAGGRLYPAKDGRMDRRMFEAGYPALADFRRWRDPACRSDFSNRMQL